MCFGMISIVLYSLYAAILRYLYLVHGEMVEKLGKNRTICVLYWIYYAHTFIWSLCIVLNRPFGGRYNWVASCYGWKEQIFLLEVPEVHNAQPQLGILESRNGKLSLYPWLYIMIEC